MLVQRILDFIRSIEEAGEPILCDVSLCDYLSVYFSKKSANEPLKKEDIQVLLECYQSRWDAVIDTDHDYTRNASHVNQLWVGLARELEPVAKQNYLKILIPRLINDFDLNDLSPLTETVNLVNFYLGHGDNILYRKLSFCQHLERGQFVLSTHRHSTERLLNVVTIDELARLKLCKHTGKQVAINMEVFDNFWDLMCKKVFTHLQDKGHIPIGLLPHLLELVERYYLLQSSKLDFSVFRNEVKHFFRRMYDYNLVAVNYLYGEKVDYDGGEHYLLDVFIDLHRATNFSEMELAMHTISKWLFHFNPELRAANPELAGAYEQWSKKETDLPLMKREQADGLEHSCRLLVALLTTKFKGSSSLTKKSHSLWDKSNEIPSELGKVFTVLLPFIAENNSMALAEAYERIIQDTIVPVSSDTSWLTWVIRPEKTVQWLNLVKESKFNELNVYWFEPELLFAGLRLFNTYHQSLKAHIRIFLDDLIHTYAQDQNELMKQIRVNILFHEFLSGLGEHHRINLLRLIKICDPQRAKATFANNCAAHIHERLSQLGQIPIESRTSHFFPQLHQLDCGKLFKLPEEKKDISVMITEYKTQLIHLNLEPKIAERLGSYLLKIGQPILTVEQKEMAKSGSRPLDYMGQYT